MSSTANITRPIPSAFTGAFPARALAGGGETNFVSSSRPCPSGVRIIAMWLRTPSSSTRRSTPSPSTVASPSRSSPSSTKNATAAWRSSTTIATLSSRSTVTRGRSDPEHHVLGDRVVVDRVHREVLAVARLLEAAVGHLGDEREVVIDPDRPELDRLGDAHRSPDVVRPDRRGQSEADVIGPGDGLLLVREALDRDDWSEDLVLDDLALLI